MLEAAQHNNSISENYAIFANSTMYTHNPRRIQPMPPPQAKAADPVCTIKQNCASQAVYDLNPAIGVAFRVAMGCGLKDWRRAF